MAPKQFRTAQPAAIARRGNNAGYFGSAWATLTAQENASVVRSVAVFGAAVALFSSSWSEFLLPPL